MARTLILIRHGQIRANRVGLWHGAIDSSLTSIGRRQVTRVANQLKGTLGGPGGEAASSRIEAVYSSPLLRCRDTAAGLAGAFSQPVILDDDLREYSIGELEGTPFRTLHAEYNFFEKIHDPEYHPPGGESLKRVGERMVRALRRIDDAHPTAEHVVVVGHGAAMGIALACLLDDDPTRWTNYAFSNCSITELVLAPTPQVPSFNRTEHL